MTPLRGYMPVSERCSGAVHCHGNPLASQWESVSPGTGYVGLIYLAEMILRCYTEDEDDRWSTFYVKEKVSDSIQPDQNNWGCTDQLDQSWYLLSHVSMPWAGISTLTLFSTAFHNISGFVSGITHCGAKLQISLMVWIHPEIMQFSLGFEKK